MATKTYFLFLQLIVMAFVTLACGSSESSEDVFDVLATAKSAYDSGEYELAQELFGLILERSSDDVVSKEMLFQASLESCKCTMRLGQIQGES